MAFAVRAAVCAVRPAVASAALSIMGSLGSRQMSLCASRAAEVAAIFAMAKQEKPSAPKPAESARILGATPLARDAANVAEVLFMERVLASRPAAAQPHFLKTCTVPQPAYGPCKIFVITGDYCRFEGKGKASIVSGERGTATVDFQVALNYVRIVDVTDVKMVREDLSDMKESTTLYTKSVPFLEVAPKDIGRSEEEGTQQIVTGIRVKVEGKGIIYFDLSQIREFPPALKHRISLVLQGVEL